MNCWLDQSNFTELCHLKVRTAYIEPGFVRSALAVRKDAMATVRLWCHGQA